MFKCISNRTDNPWIVINYSSQTTSSSLSSPVLLGPAARCHGPGQAPAPAAAARSAAGAVGTGLPTFCQGSCSDDVRRGSPRAGWWGNSYGPMDDLGVILYRLSFCLMMFDYVSLYNYLVIWCWRTMVFSIFQGVERPTSLQFHGIPYALSKLTECT